MKRIAWIAEDEADMLRSLLIVGQMLTYVNGKLITPLEVLASVDTLSGDEAKVKEIKRRTNEALSRVHGSLNRLGDKGPLNDSDIKEIQETADDDSEVAIDIVKELDVLPCIYVLDYDKDAESNRIRVGLQPCVDPKLAGGVESFAAANRELGAIWWHEDYMTFLGYVAQIAAISSRIPRLLCALMIQGAYTTKDETPCGIDSPEAEDEAVNTLAAFDTVFSADIAEVSKLVGGD